VLELLFILLLSFHLLLVNVASAAPLVCLWLEWKSARTPTTLPWQAARYLGWACEWSLLLGALLGLCLFALSWNDAFQKLWVTTLGYRAGWGVAEYAFSLILMLIYNRWITSSLSTTRFWQALRMLLLFLAGTNLLYHFPLLFSIASTMHIEAKLEHPLTRATFLTWMARPDILSRVTHVILASFAVTGVVLMAWSLRLAKDTKQLEHAKTASKWGAWLALFSSLPQLLVGMWLIATLPPNWQQRLMGGDWLAPLLLCLSLFLTIILLQDLATLALGEYEKKLVHRTMLVMLLIVVFMTGTLRRMRPPVPTPAVNEEISLQTQF
jgi:cytochrome bd-type quinol oxidase subunit 1